MIKKYLYLMEQLTYEDEAITISCDERFVNSLSFSMFLMTLYLSINVPELSKTTAFLHIIILLLVFKNDFFFYYLNKVYIS